MLRMIKYPFTITKIVFMVLYFLLNQIPPFLMLIENSYFTQLSNMSIVILNYVFALIAVVVGEKKIIWNDWSLIGVAIVVLIGLNLLFHGIYQEEWLHFAYPVSVLLSFLAVQSVKIEPQYLEPIIWTGMIGFITTCSCHFLIGSIRERTGSTFSNRCFANYGTYTTFLTIFFPVLSAQAIFGASQWKYLRWISGLTALGIFFLTVYNNVRSCWISCLAIVGYYTFSRNRHGLKNRFFLKALSSLLVILVFAYFVKQDSADGRWFIYSIAFGLLVDHFGVGVGWNRFEANYGYYQADYFKNHVDPKATWLADDIAVAYNEFLQSVIELGVGMLILWLWIFWKSLKYIKQIHNNSVMNWHRYAWTASLISFILINLWSYPLNVMELTQAMYLNFLFLKVIHST